MNIKKTRNIINKINGKKGGRPKQDSKTQIKLPDIDLVVLTQEQYNLLIKKYDYKLLKTALLLLDNWLKTGSKYAIKYIGKNNYAHFRSDGWVINEAKIKLTKS